MEKIPLHEAKASRRGGVLRGRIKFRRGWDKPLPEDLLVAFEGSE